MRRNRHAAHLHTFSFVLTIGYVLASGAAAQEIRAALSGRVIDESGSSVPGAKVRIANRATNVAVEVTTNVEGNYVAPFLTPGEYSVSVEKEGFSRAVRDSIILQTQQRLGVDFTLKAGTPASSQVTTFNSNTSYVGSSDGYRTVLPGVSITNPFPNGYNPITGNSLGLLSLLGSGVTFYKPDRQLPSIHQIQITVQRQLPWTSVLELAYVGARYNSLFTEYSLNEVPDA